MEKQSIVPNKGESLEKIKQELEGMYTLNKEGWAKVSYYEKKYAELVESHAELLGIAKTIAFWFGNEANYPEGTLGYRACQEAKQAIEKAKQITTIK